MSDRFQSLEIDERTRELRAGGRVRTVQPRVFDLIVYLVRNRDRVVPKDELLEKVWPGVLVTDASLQRAVSVARSACMELGVRDAIRTFARQGYRFCGDVGAVGDAPAAPVSEGAGRSKQDVALAEARAAYAAGDCERAIECFGAADVGEGLGAEDLQRWAHAAQCAGRSPEVALPLERAVAAYAARGDLQRAGWGAVLLSLMNFELADPMAAKGWLHRAARFLERFPDSREQGYVEYLRARIGLSMSDFDGALVAAQRAQALGQRHRDPDLEFLGLLFAGEVKLSTGRIEEGLAMLDEAGVAVRASGVTPLAGSMIYCGVIYGCLSRVDWERAIHWTEQFERWCGERGGVSYPGLCRLHRAEVLGGRGELADAQREIESARQMLAERSPWALGDAWRVVGDLQLARGQVEEAEASFRRAHEHGWDPQPGLSLVELYRGKPADALRLLIRALNDTNWATRQRRGLLLGWAAISAALAGEGATARDILASLDANPKLWSTSALTALVTRARAELAAVEGRGAEAISLFRSAIAQWTTIESPLLAAQARCRLADLLVADGDERAAELELSAAATAFERAGAREMLAQSRKQKRALRK
jgi:DNA-binding winged helix-turn-helix (wHTH) protein